MGNAFSAEQRQRADCKEDYARAARHLLGHAVVTVAGNFISVVLVSVVRLFWW
jgi:hypothetical protein